MKKHKMKIYTPKEIKDGLLVLKKKWNKIKVGHSNVKFIEKIFKEVETNLKKCIVLHGIEGMIDHLNATKSYTLLKVVMEEKELNYYKIASFTQPSDLIKLFIEYSDRFSDQEYWQNLGNAYLIQNYKKIPYKTYYKLFSSSRPFRQELMSEEEREILAKLPKKIKIFRGGTLTEKKTKKYGISWTLDKKIAEQFADIKKIRDKKEMIILEKTISKDEVIAYFNSREEEEIIYLG